MVKLIVSGSRDITRHQYNEACELCEFEFDFILTGGARGPDTFAIEDAEDCGIDHDVIKADWEKHGRAIAGRWRNQTLADEGDMLFAVWDGQSKGTEDMIQRAIAKGLPYLVILVKGDSKPVVWMQG